MSAARGVWPAASSARYRADQRTTVVVDTSLMGIDPQSHDVVVVLTNNDELAPDALAWLLALRS